MFAAAVIGQDAKPEIKISQVDVRIDQQFTPQIQATNVVDKRWKPKQWLEIQVDLKAAIARSLGGREGTYPAIEVKYYLALAGVKTKDNKQVVMTGTISYKDVANGENHTLGFITPATMKRLLQKETGGKGDISVFGVEITAGGDVVGGKSSTGSKFWEAADKISFEDAVISKEKTPFAPFWGDFDLAASK
ncbi:MAG: hypothetical protein JWO94_3262 [Verrucomicrobiaceae bacterium]|nr:hypothetical protein [Verrucomicrobiaceae bacterium]